MMVEGWGLKIFITFLYKYIDITIYQQYLKASNILRVKIENNPRKIGPTIWPWGGTYLVDIIFDRYRYFEISIVKNKYNTKLSINTCEYNDKSILKFIFKRRSTNKNNNILICRYKFRNTGVKFPWWKIEKSCVDIMVEKDRNIRRCLYRRWNEKKNSQDNNN